MSGGSIGDPYVRRRAAVLESLGGDGALVLAAAPELRVGHDTELRYVVDPDLFYLTGYSEPEAVLVLSAASEPGPFTLFVRPRDASREQWTGVRGGLEAAREAFGADEAYPVTELAERLPKLLSGVERVYARPGGERPEVDALVLAVFRNARRTRTRRGIGPSALLDPGLLLDDMRLVKDETERAALRRAAEVTVAAFRDAAAGIHEGAPEWSIEAALESGFRTRGASGPAFPSIVASGANAVVMHYVSNASTVRAGDLVLLDAGARVDMYCADISRTFAVGAAPSGARRLLHDGVRAARDAAIACARPGSTIDDVDGAARALLIETLRELGLIDATLRPGPELDGAVKRYYPHRTSHWLGLDVHDVGDYVRNGEPRRLADGMVFTVEPGLYVPVDDEGAPAELRGVGVRIEDDVLITTDGCDVLTAALACDPVPDTG